ncbi:DUF2911 domain-containing protein [Hymenobacter algoricola]|uniref:Uncharacterized protein n=1 Tax=Hymenobacter algoricola TaxID=486267 RepID=A0ABP7MM39_9BACT
MAELPAPAAGCAALLFRRARNAGTGISPLAYEATLTLGPAEASLILSTPAAQAQQRLNVPQPSPAMHILQDFSTSYIDLKYLRPSLRGRKIFGKVRPYVTVWRTGASIITKVRFGEEVKSGGPAGVGAGEGREERSNHGRVHPAQPGCAGRSRREIARNECDAKRPLNSIRRPFC